MINIDRLFIGSELKIERANKHIADLKTLTEGVVNGDSCRLHIEKDGKTGNDTLKIDSIKPLPPDAVLIIGDAVHKLHTALDLMMSEIVRDPDRYTRFPFFETRQEVVGQMDSGKIKAAGHEICDLIMNTIKPYRGGNDTLYGLHDLDIVDKHRRLIVILDVVSITIDAEDENGKLPVELVARIGPNGLLNAGFGSGKLHIKNYEQPILDIRFGSGEIFAGDSVIETLNKLSQLVSGVVHAIEQKYIART